MKVLFYIQTMKGGGAARLLALLANELVDRGEAVGVATNIYHDIVYSLRDKIDIFSLYPENSYEISRFSRMTKLFKSSRRIAKTFKPDVIVTMLPPVSFFTRLSTIGLHVPIVFCDVTSYARKDSLFVHFVRYHFYKFADAVTIQTENDRRILGNKLSKKVVINNPLSYPIFKGESIRERKILSIGHTKEWEIKGFDILIKAFGKIADKHPEWRIDIAGGTTPDTLAYLKSLITENKVEGRVNFIGFQSHIDEVMRKSAVFALPSRIEGFSLSLVEAMSQGCPAVAFRIKGVITDVTDNGHGVLLTEDYDITQFSENLDKLLSDSNLRKQLSEEGKAFVAKYDIKNIVDQWQNLFNRLTQL